MGRREEICEKAPGLFIAEGYDQTPFSRIADALGFTEAGIYHCFKSKEDLLFSIREYNPQKTLIPLLDAADKIDEPEKRPAYFIKEHTDKALIKDASMRVLIHEVHRLKPEHQRRIRERFGDGSLSFSAK